MTHPSTSFYEYIANALRRLANACQCLTNGLANVTNLQSEYDAGLIVFLNLIVLRHSQGMGNGERYKRLENAL